MSSYVPKPDLEGINSQPDRKVWLDLMVLLSSLALIVGITLFLLGTFGEWAFTRMSIETEMKIFTKFNQSSQNEDTKINQVQTLVNKLQPYVPFHLDVRILCEERPNALAMPGGKILLTTGLFKTVKSENGLAFVLGHEIGHFVNRDHMRGLGRNLMIQLFGSLLGLSMNDQSTTQLIQNLSSRSFSRSDEEKADDFGLQLMQKVYGHSFGSEEFFDSLRKEEGIFEHLNSIAGTHPLSSERYENVIRSQGPVKTKTLLPPIDFAKWLVNVKCH